MVAEKGRPSGLSFGPLRIAALENMHKEKIELHRVYFPCEWPHKSWELEYFCHLTTEIQVALPQVTLSGKFFARG